LRQVVEGARRVEYPEPLFSLAAEGIELSDPRPTGKLLRSLVAIAPDHQCFYE